jgi:hypothetical protein
MSNCDQIRTLLNRAGRWNNFARTRGIILPNQDSELWGILKKLLADALNQNGDHICVFEVYLGFPPIKFWPKSTT